MVTSMQIFNGFCNVSGVILRGVSLWFNNLSLPAQKQWSTSIAAALLRS